MRTMFYGPQSSSRSYAARSSLPSSVAGEVRQHGPRTTSRHRAAAVTRLVHGAADTMMRHEDLVETVEAVFAQRSMPDSQDAHFWRQLVSEVLDSAAVNVDGSTISDYTNPVARAVTAGALFKAVTRNRIDLETAYDSVSNGTGLPAADDREKFAAVRAAATESLNSVLTGVGLEQGRRSINIV